MVFEVPERDLAGREFATSQIALPCGSSKVDEHREPQAKTEPAVGSELASLVPAGRPPSINSLHGTGDIAATRYWLATER